MYAVMDSPAPGQARIVNYNQWKGLFFVLWIIIGSWFLKNLFAGLNELFNYLFTPGYAISSFTKEYYKMVGSEDLNIDQQKWLKTYKLLVDVVPAPMYSRPLVNEWLSRHTNVFSIIFREIDLFFRKICFKLAISPSFEKVSFFVILINIITMAISFYNEV